MKQERKGNGEGVMLRGQRHTRGERTSVPYNAESIKLEGGRDRKMDVIAIVKPGAGAGEGRGAGPVF